jgi:hypothetical protein
MHSTLTSTRLARTDTVPDEVKSRAYPGPKHTYPMAEEDLREFTQLVEATAS